ncbi:MAG: hypothetical protein RL220_1392 [Bacteroidota bacterium]
MNGDIWKHSGGKQMVQLLVSWLKIRISDMERWWLMRIFATRKAYPEEGTLYHPIKHSQNE